MKTQYDTANELLKTLDEKIDIRRNAIYFKTKNESIQLITIEPFYDYECKLKRLELYGYFFRVQEIGRITPQTMSVDVFYGDYIYNNIISHYVKHFYIAALDCIPNKGYGSIMMEQFLKYIKPFGAEYVNGIITNYDAKDIEHKNRLFHFYRKFNFEIGSLNEQGDYPIKLNLHT